MSASYPNEPGGTTLINDWGHNAIVGGGWTDVYNTTGYNTTIVSDATAPISPNNVLQQRFPAGLVGGNGGGGGNLCYFNTWYPQGIFWGFHMKVGNTFVNHPVATKIAWIHTRKGNVAQMNELFYALHGSNPYYITVNYQNSDTNNSHLGGPSIGTILLYPSGGATISRGTWFRFETLFKPSSTPTARDGVWKVWIDGSLTINVTTLNTQAIYPDSISHITIWGGVGSVNAADTYLYWDHTYASALSGGPVAPVLTPTISSITPTSGPVGTPLTIVGTNFDEAETGNTVTVNGTACVVLSSVPTQINTAIPNTATSGTVQVTTSQGTASSPVPLTVTQPDPGGGTGGGTGGGAGATTSVFTTDFNGTQGPRWYYLNGNGTQMTYSAGSQLWSGAQLYQGIWNGGFHPGTSSDAVLKYVVPGTGSVRITGQAYDLDTGGGNGVVFTIKKNGSTSLFSRAISNGQSSGGDYDVSSSVITGDYFTFEVNSVGDNGHDSTRLNPTVVYTPQPQVEETITLALTTLTAEEQTSQTITLTISPTRATDSVVSLTSSLPTSVAVPETVTILANASSTPVAVVLGVPGSATITATLGASSTTSSVTSVAAPDPEEPVPVSPTLSAYTDFLLSYRWF